MIDPKGISCLDSVRSEIAPGGQDLQLERRPRLVHEGGRRDRVFGPEAAQSLPSRGHQPVTHLLPAAAVLAGSQTRWAVRPVRKCLTTGPTRTMAKRSMIGYPVQRSRRCCNQPRVCGRVCWRARAVPRSFDFLERRQQLLRAHGSFGLAHALVQPSPNLVKRGDAPVTLDLHTPVCYYQGSHGTPEHFCHGPVRLASLPCLGQPCRIMNRRLLLVI